MLTLGNALQNGDTPLMNAVFGGLAELVRLLLEAGAEKNAKREVRWEFLRLGRCSGNTWRFSLFWCGGACDGLPFVSVLTWVVQVFHH